MRYLFPISPWNQQRQFEKPVWVYPAHLAMYATYLRNWGHEVKWGEFQKLSKPGFFDTYDSTRTTNAVNDMIDNTFNNHKNYDRVIENDFQINVPFDQLPFPDRTFTDAKNKRWLSYGNYKFSPGTHFMSSNLCWWAGAKGCVFCIDSKKIMEGEKRGVRTTDHVMAEIEDCVSLGFKEMFDDAGTIPINDWLEDLCHKMIKSGLNRKIVLGCNLKPIKQQFGLMREAGFRFILVGVESANQKTIDKIQKGQRCEKVVENLKAMSEAGLEPHATFMLSCPDEDHADNMRTVRLAQYLLKKGYAKTAQASVYSPPRTQPDPNSPGHKYIPMIYDAYKSPTFWIRKLSDIRRLEDVTYLLRGARLVAEEKWRKTLHAFSTRKSTP